MRMDIPGPLDGPGTALLLIGLLNWDDKGLRASAGVAGET